MRFLMKILSLTLIGCCLIWRGSLIADKVQLDEHIIRMHIVANSDAPEDQSLKLQLKDALVAYLQPALEQLPDKAAAAVYIQENLTEIQQKANSFLQELGINLTTEVSFERESFDRRDYDTFSLPSGVYDALRVKIGAGEGRNWWCVAFPSLCLPATSDAFADTAVSAGFSDTLTDTLSRSDGYELRFFFLDLLGKMEIFFL